IGARQRQNAALVWACPIHQPTARHPLAREHTEQSIEIAVCPSVLVGARKTGGKLVNRGGQLRAQGLDILHGQIAERQRTGRCYNSRGHGVLPQTGSKWFEERIPCHTLWSSAA